MATLYNAWFNLLRETKEKYEIEEECTYGTDEIGPSHTTHVLQGLDVVLFATVKHCLTDERDTWERKTGEQINKTNFLGIYGRAHLRALTRDNVKAAF